MLFSSLVFALLPSALAVNIDIAVAANNGLTFTPNQTTAAVGDTLTFTFLTKNHTVTTTVFSGAVCPPPAGGVGPNGFDSGFLPATATDTPTFVYTVVDTAPHFAACMQGGGSHCRAGMTFALNPTAEETYAEFNTNAANS